MRNIRIAAVAKTAVAFCVASLGLAGNGVASPVIIGEHYFENASVGCVSGSACELVFSAVANGKELVVTRVSCGINEQKNRLVFVQFGIRNNGHISRQEYLPATLEGGTTGLFRHVVNSEVGVVSHGAPPMLKVVSDLATTFGLECQITGILTSIGT